MACIILCSAKRSSRPVNRVTEDFNVSLLAREESCSDEACTVPGTTGPMSSTTATTTAPGVHNTTTDEREMTPHEVHNTKTDEREMALHEVHNTKTDEREMTPHEVHNTKTDEPGHIDEASMDVEAARIFLELYDENGDGHLTIG